LHPFFAPKGKQAAMARKDGVGGVDTDILNFSSANGVSLKKLPANFEFGN
jgi:hypothetical protein